MRNLSLVVLAAVLMVAIPGAAEVGSFASFSTNVTVTGNQLDFDLLLTTNGATSPTPSDAVIMGVVMGPVNQTVTTCSSDQFTALATTSTGGPVYRTGTSDDFEVSVSFSGLTDTAYKWAALAFYGSGSPDIYSTTFFSVWYPFLYSTLCPWITGPTVTAGSFLWNFTDVTPTETGVWRQGIVLGRQELTGLPVPTLGTWALLVLGVALAATGVFILRRA